MATDLQTWLNDVLRQQVQYRESKVCVVTIIGKSPTSGFWNKVNPINDALGRKAFENLACVSRKSLDSGSEVEAYFDADVQAVFLHLIGPYDLSLQGQTFPPEGELMHPTCRLDTSYIRLFRTLEYMREKTQNAVCHILADTSGVSKSWATNGRLCTPRLLFGFHRPPTFMKADGTVEARQGPYRKVERSLGDQIYGLFRKSRLITNNTSNALISLPMNQAFVYVFPAMEEPRDIIQDLLNSFRSAGTKEQSDSFGKSGDEFGARGGGFKEFLLDHIDLAHSDGFNDNLGKLPKLKSFVRGLGGLYDYFVLKYHDNLELEDLPDSLDVMVRFSEGRCKKMYPIAVSAYMDGLPQYYSSRYHQGKLAQALQMLYYQARGPSLENARTQLIEECEHHWRNGHQSCEVLSLTDNPCVNRVHRTSDCRVSPAESDGDVFLPLLRHTSKIKYLSTCNCGRRQAWRDDPFELREANYEFYEWRDEFECCRRRIIDRIVYPVYVPQRTVRSVSQEGEGDGKGEGVKEEPIHKEEEPERHKRVKDAEKMFDRLKLATQSQEDNDGQGPSAGDLLPDRDNKPASSRQNECSASLAEIDAFANAATFAEQEGPVVKTQEEAEERRRNVESAVDGSDDAPAESPFRNSSSEERKVDHESVFAGLLDEGGAMEINLRASGEDSDDSSIPGASENEGPVEEGENSDKEERAQAPERTPSRSTETRILYEGDKSDWEEEEEDEIRRDRATSDRNRLDDTGAKEGVDYLGGMVHNLCPLGLAPLFSSWSLVCIGSSSIYSHSHGLRDQPNFSHGSNFLLPWDVELHVDIERWQDQMEQMAASTTKRPGPYKKPRQPKKGSNGSVTVKVFIGFEYECPRGHRFMLQKPNRILKHPLVEGGAPKDNGGVLVKNDMPLWFPCSCRQAKSGFPGQLMRVHIVTPKAPVVVAVNPRVQPRRSDPGKPPLIFHPGAPGPAELGPAKYWILRFPFVYVGSDGPCYPPRDTAADGAGRVLRAMISVFPDLEQLARE